MAIDIKMPQLSDTMSSGKILGWKKKEGDSVARGDILAEVETDKANLEIECFHPGTLLKITINEGQTASVGDVIAIVGQAGEQVGATNGAPKPAAPSTPSPAPSASVAAPVESSAAQTQKSPSGDRVIASPLAKKIAAEGNVDLSGVHGSGPGGRIVKKDVDAAMHGKHSSTSSTSESSKPVVSPPKASPPPAAGSLIPFSKMRETIARRMQESMTQNPHFYVTTTITMDEAFRLRETLKEKHDYKGISVNHLVICAAAHALSKEPAVNYAVKDGQLYCPPQINIGIVTAIDDGLLIPVIKDTDKLTLKDLVFEARAAIERAKAGRPNSSDLSGGTFSISNMGMFDVENFTAIINPGQGAILAVSSTKEEPIVVNGEIKIAKRMKVTLSSDHRIIDGIMAARFLKVFKEGLEMPALLFV